MIMAICLEHAGGIPHAPPELLLAGLGWVAPLLQWTELGALEAVKEEPCAVLLTRRCIFHSIVAICRLVIGNTIPSDLL